MTRAEAGELLQKVAAVYGDGKAPVDTLAGVWCSVLGDLGRPHVAWAVDHYIGSDARFFPKPGQIRKLALEHAGQQGDQDTSLGGQHRRWYGTAARGNGDPCPVCGAVLEVLPSGRYGTRCDKQLHLQRGIGVIG